jgi:hypothetical protein
MAKPVDQRDRRLALTVSTTSGSFKDEFNSSNRARKILEEAIRRLNLDPDPPRGYVLRRQSDNLVLTLDEKLGDLALHDGDVILVQAPQAQDGASA